MNCMFGNAVAVVLVNSSDNVAYVVGFEEFVHVFVDVLGALVGAESTRVSAEKSYEALVCMNEVILVGEKVAGFGSCCRADEDDEVGVASSGFRGDFAAEVAVDIFPRDS